MYKENNKKTKQLKRKLLILPLILCLSSCNVKKNIELENGEYVTVNAYQHGALNTLGAGQGFNVSITDYHISINNMLYGELKNIRMKDKYFSEEIIYWCFNDYSKETLNDIMSVEKAMKTELNGTVSFPFIEGTYYLVEANGELFLLLGESSLRIYALIKEEDNK